jgi:mono/diheme cytochrome c family protein
MIRLAALIVILSLAGVTLAAPENDSGDEPQNDSTQQAKNDSEAVVRWSFDRTNEPGQWSKPVYDAGPRPPSFPAFAADNRAAFFSLGSQLVLADDQPKVSLRFSQEESITLEAWVRVRQLKLGQYAYIVGKGRSLRKGFAEKNHNYALRLKGDRDGARVSFLFASQATEGKPGEWHRWTSQESFELGARWHHVAVTYTFGKPKSVHGYVDGRDLPGTWDLGGATTRAPVEDADDLIVGAGNGGATPNAFDGWMDDVTIRRGAVPAEVIQARFVYLPPPPPVKRESLPPGQVLVQLCETGLPQANAWPIDPPPATDTYYEQAFGFAELPQKYVDTGVRGDRASPLLMRAAALVTLPTGQHRLLIRARGASRLLIDNQPVLRTTFAPGDDSGHGKVKAAEEYLDLGPDFRFAPAGEQEAWTYYDANPGEHFVVFETLVGGFVNKAQRRPELGETVVAVSLAGTESWQLLTSGNRAIDNGPIPYTDEGWAAYASQQRLAVEALNTRTRASLRAAHAKFWEGRRQAAKAYLAQTAEVPVPQLPAGYPASGAIDHFIAARLATAKAQTSATPAGGVHFYGEILPILDSKCFDCHRGGKVQGGLRLDSLASAAKGGESEEPAIVPGKPDRSALLARIRSTDPDDVMPPKGERLTSEQVALVERWIGEGAHWPEFQLDRSTFTPLCDDLTFLRRVTLDTLGVVPSIEEIRAFQADPPATRRSLAIDRLLADPRWADHWMGYWQDVLAENPNILNPTLNNTGPFRWWINESLRDDKPMDLFVTELLRMRGSERFGGPAGFGVASQNDAPFAAKGTIVSTAFLGVELKCARCHDAPAHKSKQVDLFSLAALLAAASVEVPKTSSVALDKLSADGRTPLIQVTLKPGSKVEPKWPFGELCNESIGAKLAEEPLDPRDRLAALITAPQNERFAQVIANRVWQRLMGRGLVEPVDDWEKGQPSHPELLRWLGRELVRGGYQIKPLARLIFNSQAYQRTVDEKLRETGPLFVAPAPRRLSAEQVVDSLFIVTGKPFRVEEVNLDVDGRRDLKNSISLGQPTRCWMLASTSNERDRPSLSLPRVQAVADVMQAFGWRPARQDPASVRDTAPNALQPAILANGTVSIWLTRLSDDHAVTQLALEDQPLEKFLDTLFLKVLTRQPSAEEKTALLAYLRPGYDTRRRDVAMAAKKPAERGPKRYISWSNHLDPESTTLRQQEEAAARRGDLPTERLATDWRNRLEDVLWALVNAPEFVFSQ